MPFSNSLSQRYRFGGIILLSLWLALPGGCTDIIHKKAMTREEALELGRGAFRALPLPESATNIFYYAEIDGLQCLDSFLRFDVSTAELDSAVDAIIANNNAQLNRNLAYTRQTLPAGAYNMCVVEKAKLDWWSPDTITQGYYRGELAAYAARMWIDEENHRIYLYTSD